MYERRDEPLLTRAEFAVRWLVHFLVAIGFVVLSLAAGMLGFVCFENKHVNSFHDALLNAAMLLGGMGPIHIPETPGGKLFATLYALYAGLAFLGVMGLLLPRYCIDFSTIFTPKRPVTPDGGLLWSQRKTVLPNHALNRSRRAT